MCVVALCTAALVLRVEWQGVPAHSTRRSPLRTPCLFLQAGTQDEGRASDPVPDAASKDAPAGSTLIAAERESALETRAGNCAVPEAHASECSPAPVPLEGLREGQEPGAGPHPAPSLGSDSSSVVVTPPTPEVAVSSLVAKAPLQPALDPGWHRCAPLPVLQAPAASAHSARCCGVKRALFTRGPTSHRGPGSHDCGRLGFAPVCW